MDYTLKSLRKAFENVKYKRSRSEFDIFAFLLATSLDRQFVLQYLSHFYELHHLTGNHMLVIGPSLKQINQRRNIPEDDPLETIKGIVNHNIDSPKAKNAYKLADHFLQFMQDQTRESYDFARFIGLRTDAMPVMVFFQSLDSPQEFVTWKLSGMTGEAFVRALRTLVEELSQRCHWAQQDRIKSLEQSIAAEISPWNKPAALAEAENELLKVQSIVSFHKCLHSLRQAHDKACNNPALKIPLTNAGKNIAALENGTVSRESFDHFEKYYRRWKSRLPRDYKATIESLLDLRRAVLANKTELSLEKAKGKVTQLTKTVMKLTESHEATKTTNLIDLRRQLSAVQNFASSQREKPLEVIRRFTSAGTTTFGRVVSHINLCDVSDLGESRVPRIFISYSHDTDLHKDSVSELAQRLRGDGIDCWIDQFESNASEGLVRWMQVQIERSDYVLIVCTAAYKRRFDGAEEAGKGLGVKIEGHFITQELCEAEFRNHKFIPITFPAASQMDIPKILRGFMWYQLPKDYESLYAHITNQPRVSPRQLGRLRSVKY